MASTRKKLVNTTGRASIATLKNNMVVSESPVVMAVGTVVEQVGDLKGFMDSTYFYDATGKLYNMQDFANVTQEVVLTPNSTNVPKTDNTMLWIGGGLFLVWLFSGNSKK